jgi:hypothetical protein
VTSSELKTETFNKFIHRAYVCGYQSWRRIQRNGLYFAGGNEATHGLLQSLKTITATPTYIGKESYFIVVIIIIIIFFNLDGLGFWPVPIQN